MAQQPADVADIASVSSLRIQRLPSPIAVQDRLVIYDFANEHPHEAKVGGRMLGLGSVLVRSAPCLGLGSLAAFGAAVATGVVGLEDTALAVGAMCVSIATSALLLARPLVVRKLVVPGFEKQLAPMQADLQAAVEAQTWERVDRIVDAMTTLGRRGAAVDKRLADRILAN